MTDAHRQTRTLHETVFYAEHDPRKASAEYVRTHHHLIDVLDEPCWVCGVRKSTLADPKRNPHGAKALETHHWHLEWALANGVDPAKILADFPDMGAADEAHLRAWLDSEGNMLVLCLDGDAPILLPDGRWLRIAELQAGDSVETPDGPTTIAATMSREYDGELVELVPGCWATSEHPVFTARGWVAAGELLPDDLVPLIERDDVVRMSVLEMLRMRGVEPQILEPVIQPVAIDVVHNFSTRQVPSESLLDHPAMLLDIALDAIFPDPKLPVTARGDRGADLNFRPGNLLECGHPAFVTAETLDSIHGAAGVLAAYLADESAGQLEGGIAASLGIANLRAGSSLGSRMQQELGSADGTNSNLTRVALECHRCRGPIRQADRERVDSIANIGADRRQLLAAFIGACPDAILRGRDHEEVTPADLANLLDPIPYASAPRHWRRVGAIRKRLVHGHKVYDITLSNSHSYLAAGVLVHNCDVHHRHGLYGIHLITYPAWIEQRYARDGWDLATGPTQEA